MAPWWVRVALSRGNGPLAGEVVVTMEHLARCNRELPGLTTSAIHARGLFEEDLFAVQTAANSHGHAWARAFAAEDVGRLAISSDHAVARSFLAGSSGIPTGRRRPGCQPGCLGDPAL